MDQPIKIVFLGDFMPGGVMSGNCSFFSPEIKSLLDGCDIRIATLESAIGEGLDFDREKMDREDWRNIIYSPNIDLQKLKELSIDIVSLANNHIFDLGEDGLINTIQQLDRLGIKHFGAGRNYKETISPAVIEVNGKTLCFLGYMPYWWEAPHPSIGDSPGINQFIIDNVKGDIVKYKSLYDYVFVMPHWGLEYTYLPTEREREFVNEMVEVGVDGIIGAHTHQVQPIVSIKSVPVCFSLGNFYFPDFYIQPTRPIWYPDGSISIKKIPCTYEYPEKTDVYLKRVWPISSRIGQMLFLTIDKTVVDSTEFVVLDENNILRRFTIPFLIRVKLFLIGLAVKTRYYRYFLGINRRLKIIQ